MKLSGVIRQGATALCLGLSVASLGGMSCGKGKAPQATGPLADTDTVYSHDIDKIPGLPEMYVLSESIPVIFPRVLFRMPYGYGRDRAYGSAWGEDGGGSDYAWISVSPSGDIAVTDSLNSRLHLISSSGRYVKSIGNLKDATGPIAWRDSGICVMTGGSDGEGRATLAFVVDVARGEVLEQREQAADVVTGSVREDTALPDWHPIRIYHRQARQGRWRVDHIAAASYSALVSGYGDYRLSSRDVATGETWAVKSAWDFVYRVTDTNGREHIIPHGSRSSDATSELGGYLAQDQNGALYFSAGKGDQSEIWRFNYREGKFVLDGVIRQPVPFIEDREPTEILIGNNLDISERGEIAWLAKSRSGIKVYWTDAK